MKIFNRSVVCALLAASVSLASTTYTQQVSNVTTVTIPGSVHHLGCLQYSIRGYDSNGVRQPSSAFSSTRDVTTYDATVSFPSSFTGSVKLQGCFSATSAATDFQVAASAGTITVCSSCTDPAYADRLYGTQRYAATIAYTLTSNSDGQSGTAWVYLDPATARTIFAVSSASGVGTASPGARVVYSATGFPDGAVPLATVAYTSSGFTTVTDYRSFN
jgi:hypothetical protein